MMYAKVGVFVVLALCLLAGQSEAQECSAESVVNLKLEASHNLTWSLRPGEPCQVSEYVIYIFHPRQPAEYAFSVTDRSADVSFLEVCEEWVFVVVPVSGHTMGGQRRLTASLPLPTNADLSLSYLDARHNATTERTHLHWDLTDKRLGNCSLLYRVTVEEAGSPVIEDFYVDDTFIDLNFLSSCTSYQFGVRAINIASPTIEGPLRSEIHYLPGRKQSPPRLLDTETGPTWANMSFGLESEVRNPCSLRELYVDGLGIFSKTIYLSDEDGARGPVNVTITGLEPSTSYVALVYVSTTAGQSDPRLVHIVTAPSEDESQLNGEPPEQIEGSD